MANLDRRSLPRLTDDASFVGFERARGRPHVVVDGPATDGTVLGLSHWPDGDAPAELVADTSTEIAARYVDAEPDGPDVDLLTNNHYDEDGVLAAWVALHRVPPGDLRDLAIAAAHAGDFQTWTEPVAAQCALALAAMAERETTPFPDVLRALSEPHATSPAAPITNAIIPKIAGLLDDPGRYRRLWEPDWIAIARDVAELDAGTATIEEHLEIDLAVVSSRRRLSPYAVHPRTAAMRIVSATADGFVSLEHRYETWVRYVSRPLPKRRDLTPMLSDLNAKTTRPGAWRFEGVGYPQARLTFVDVTGRPSPSGLTADQLVATIARRACDHPSR